MTIKKAFLPIFDVLVANQGAVVADIMEELIALASAKTGSGGGKATTFHKNEDGEVVAVFCYYHKLWMDPREVEFGTKASSPTGLNNMCKDGVSKWTKQQRDAKKAEADLLARVAGGEVAVEDIAAEQEAIAEAAKTIIPREDGYGYETIEALLEA